VLITPIFSQGEMYREESVFIVVISIYTRMAASNFIDREVSNDIPKDDPSEIANVRSPPLSASQGPSSICHSVKITSTI